MSTEAPPQPHAAPEEQLEEMPIPRPEGDQFVAVLEALLFATTAPLSARRLCDLMGGIDEGRLAEGLDFLRQRYSSPSSGLVVWEVAGGYQLATSPASAEWVLSLHRHRRKNPLTPAMLETLAIVAYKQPLVRAEIEAIRGVDCGGVLRGLQDSGLVEVVGRRETVGRPPLYGTTDTFMKTFGLKALADLPSMGDLQKVIAAAAKDSQPQSGAETAGE